MILSIRTLSTHQGGGVIRWDHKRRIHFLSRSLPCNPPSHRLYLFLQL
jgi:hypothetical protein